MANLLTMGTFRGIVTGVLLVLFIALIGWAWSRKRTATFDAMARMPLEEEDPRP
jgi:cytochrome c oxidase cbb3-type subunit 4